MSPFLQLAFELVIILLAAKAAGTLSMRLGQPAVLGELVAGVLLGPSLVNILGLPFISSPSLGDTLFALSQIGVLLLMFLAGLELHLHELASHRRVALLASLGGMLLSIGFGWGIGRFLGLGQTAAVLLGVALGATSVSIAARTLMELSSLRSRVGLSLLGAAVADDVLSLLAFSILLAVTSGTGGPVGVIWVASRVLIFLAGATAFGWWLLPLLARWIARLHISQGPVTFAIVVLLIYGLAAELIGGMAALIGAFLAGLMLARTPEKGLIEQGISSLAHGLFVPIFFINIGLSVSLRGLHWNAVWLILAVSLAAIAGKLFGSAAGARLGGFPPQQAWQLGAGMIARGEVTLIVATLGSQRGLIDGKVLSAIVFAVLLSILLTPPMLRAAFARGMPMPPSPDARKESQE